MHVPVPSPHRLVRRAGRHPGGNSHARLARRRRRPNSAGRIFFEELGMSSEAVSVLRTAPAAEWLTPEAAAPAADALAAALGLHPITGRVLVNRGFTDPDAARRF